MGRSHPRTDLDYVCMLGKRLYFPVSQQDVYSYGLDSFCCSLSVAHSSYFWHFFEMCAYASEIKEVCLLHIWEPEICGHYHVSVASTAILIYATENCSILSATKCHCDDFSVRGPSCWVLRKKYVNICVLFSGTLRFTISNYRKTMASSIPPRCFSQLTMMIVWSLYIHWSLSLLCNMSWAEAVNKPIHFSSMLTPRLGTEQESQLLKL